MLKVNFYQPPRPGTSHQDLAPVAVSIHDLHSPALPAAAAGCPAPATGLPGTPPLSMAASQDYVFSGTRATEAALAKQYV